MMRWVRAVLSGLALGLGFAVLLVLHRRIAAGTLAPAIVILVALVLSLALSVAAEMRKRSRHTPPTAPLSPGQFAQAPPAAPTPAGPPAGSPPE